MNQNPKCPSSIEPERYELNSPPLHHFEVGRREFFRVFGGGIVVACCLEKGLEAQESGRGRRGLEGSLPQDIAAWLHIGEDGGVTVYTGKVEVGQNTRTALTQAVAEELHVSPTVIRMVMGDTDLTPFDMGTFGSRSSPTMSPQLRKAAAAARNLLIDLAAQSWGTRRERLAAKDGEIKDTETQRTVKYGVLAKGQKLSKMIPADDPLSPAAHWTVMGESLSKVNGEEIVTGRHLYPSDIRLPEMLYGKVLRPPSFAATLASVDTRAAEAIPGVTVVHDGNFVGVAAPSEAEALRAVDMIRAEWKTVPQPSGNELFDYLKKNVDAPGSQERRNQDMGSLESGFAAADQRLETTYRVAYIAHAPLEPRAAVAQWENGKLMVWTGTQRPFGVRTELAEAFRIPEDHVRVQMPDTGSGYGGKHSGETAVEAARLARTAGRPVKLVWTRKRNLPGPTSGRPE